MFHNNYYHKINVPKNNLRAIKKFKLHIWP